jgi:hypothetical protein
MLALLRFIYQFTGVVSTYVSVVSTANYRIYPGIPGTTELLAPVFTPGTPGTLANMVTYRGYRG